MKKTILALITLLICSVILSQANADNSSQNKSFKSLADIELALNPLEVIANHDGIRRSIDLNIQFKLGSAEILPSAQRQIDALGQALKGDKLSNCVISLTGHTDATGNRENNQSLSEQRANAVKQSLIDSYNITLEKLVAQGKGDTQLLAKLAVNDAKHRRVEIGLNNLEQCRAKALKNNKLQQKLVTKEKDGKLNIDW
jgi:outer membrane protein OmpA-like peptidoglycan-associated protein